MGMGGPVSFIRGHGPSFLTSTWAWVALFNAGVGMVRPLSFIRGRGTSFLIFTWACAQVFGLYVGLARLYRPGSGIPGLFNPSVVIRSLIWFLRGHTQGK